MATRTRPRSVGWLAVIVFSWAVAMAPGAASALCEVKVDKRISCDGGETFVDEGFSDNIAEACAGWSATDTTGGTLFEEGEPVMVQYWGRNETGNEDLSNCLLSDSNPALGVTNEMVGDLAAGTERQLLEIAPICSASLFLEEPDKATLECTCATPGQQSDEDEATFSCRTPDLNVTDVCGPAPDPSGYRKTIDIENPAGSPAILFNCTVMATLDPGVCPFPPDPNVPGTLIFGPEAVGPEGVLGPGITDRLQVPITLQETSCDAVWVECNVFDSARGGAVINQETGEDKVITAHTNDLCVFTPPTTTTTIPGMTTTTTTTSTSSTTTSSTSTSSTSTSTSTTSTSPPSSTTTTSTSTTLPGDPACELPSWWPEELRRQILERQGCPTDSTTTTTSSTSTTLSTTTTSTSLPSSTTTTSTTLPGDPACDLPSWWPEELRRQILERRGCPL